MFDEDNEEELLPHCSECGAEEFLNLESGLCLDCQLALEEDEGDEPEDEEECPECGENLDFDGSCPNCLYNSEDSE